MKETVYCKIMGQAGNLNNLLMPLGKYNLTKSHSAGINKNLKNFKVGDRVKITIEKMNKEEFVKAVYGNTTNEKCVICKKETVTEKGTACSKCFKTWTTGETSTGFRG